MDIKTRQSTISIIILILLASSACYAIQQGGSSNTLAHSYNVLSQQQAQNQSLIDLGYSPSSLFPVSAQIPVYTTNDELWIESNYNSTINVSLGGSQSLFIKSAALAPNTITELYYFGPGFVTQQLTLMLDVNCIVTCEQFSYPIQFVNPSGNSIGPLVTHDSIENSTLSVSLSSAGLQNKFNIQQCLTSVNSESEAVIPVPSSFGGGSIGIVGDPATSSATFVLRGALPSNPFAFSFGLLGNYTSVVSAPGSNLTQYGSSEIASAQSDSVLVERGGEANDTMTLSVLAPLREGRYVLRATFQNSNGLVQVNTPLLIESPFSSSWFWLGGACLGLSEISPTFTSQINLSGSPAQWPRYIYLMYQSLPGIEGYTNVSLDLSLNRVRFTIGGSGNSSIPSDISVSWIQNKSDSSAISDAIVSSNGVVYLITNGTYPISTTFALSFGGAIFNRTDVVLESPNSEIVQSIGLTRLQISAEEDGRGVANASVTITSDDLNSSIVLFTNGNGNVQTLVPPGKYSIYVKSGGYTTPAVEDFFVASSLYSLPFILPGQTNYTPYILWIVSIITAIGALGNLWFWLAKRKIRSSLR